jgi:signal transduction histidine kinase
MEKSPKESSDDGRPGASEVEELGRLLGELAHEIKNPLSTIKVNLRLIDEDLTDSDLSGPDKNTLAVCRRKLERSRRKIGVVARESERLEQILENFLRYADRAQPELADVDVNELTSDMVDFYVPQAHKYSITVRQQLSKAPLVCRADAAMLKQALLNLFINAQQAMGSGGELMVKTSRHGWMAAIQICDTGCGIAADKLDRIFEAYYSSRPGGSGLGLPTAKRIIEAHSGKITVASEPGRGTAFTIHLPLAEGLEQQRT